MDLLKQLTAANKARCPEFGHEINDWNPLEWAGAVSGETGELANVCKKVHRGDMTIQEANDKHLIANEAADAVIYLDLLCQRVGIDLSSAIVHKFNCKSQEIGSDVKLQLNK